VAKANGRFPSEALQVDEANLKDVRSHYEYVAEHEEILKKLAHLQ